jgi:ribosomal-protein-alanine N-acetyltransferase
MVSRSASIVIRLMRAADLAAVVEIEHASPEASGWDATSLEAELARTWAHCWVACDGDEDRVTAFAITWIVADELHVLNVATAVEHRRKGLARGLLDHSQTFAYARGARKIVLEVRASNAPAIALYRAFGFRAMGLRRKYYADGEDALDMIAFLDEATGVAIAGPDEL